ncbi:selenocysteine-specific translation elongation factor [Lacrimispora indolis]|uniref:selenocysteine-specific translation elongation factor n=1 Tax=Lacrimispora indolis TaxID=69825 RepID=UPI0004063580|nr:selenocysteine-specific translation elongation factor [[Clostridium] methoxybenzovorans]
MDSIIVGTAGHIDHGKTALVKALTGHDTDTLAEEKKRGISINLGFTGFQLPNGRTLGIVDVPGHERFIKNMLAGATGIDAALIIIAANEGIMPQTREHMDILSYLGIQKFLIVLTKIDLVDEEFKELVIEDIQSFIKGTFLEGSKIVEVDSVSRKGFNDLIRELEILTSNIRERSFTKKPRMNIDRVFSVKGYGTVVTGTLMEGVLKAEDELVVYPQGIVTKVRNLQVHEHNVESAYAGQRTAINLSNVAVDELKRGNTVATKDGVFVTDRIDVKFSIVKTAKLEMGRFYKLKLYVGAAEEVARFVPITHKKVKAGDEGYGQILLDHEIAVLKGDRFVLRTISPVTTIGGGVIIDPKAGKYKNNPEERLKSLQMKDSASSKEIIEEYIKNNPFSTHDQIAAFLNKDIKEEELKELEADETILFIEKQYIHAEYLMHYRYMVEDILNDYHKKNRLRRGIPKAELLEKLDLSHKKQCETMLKYLAGKNLVRLEQNLVSCYDFEPALTEGQKKVKAELAEKILESGYTFLTAGELTENAREKQQVLEFMLQDGFMVLPGQYILAEDQYKKAKERAETLFYENGVLKLPDFRDSIGTSRKFALMLLERFDQEKFTRRQGDDRVLNTKK